MTRTARGRAHLGSGVVMAMQAAEAEALCLGLNMGSMQKGGSDREGEGGSVLTSNRWGRMGRRGRKGEATLL